MDWPRLRSAPPPPSESRRPDWTLRLVKPTIVFTAGGVGGVGGGEAKRARLKQAKQERTTRLADGSLG